MDSIIAFLNQPVVLTLPSLTVGGYLLSLLSDRRARKDKTRDKSIDLLTDIGNDINIVTGGIYGHLRAQNMKVMRNHVLMDGMGKLFTMRLGREFVAKLISTQNDSIDSMTLSFGNLDSWWISWRP